MDRNLLLSGVLAFFFAGCSGTTQFLSALPSSSVDQSCGECGEACALESVTPLIAPLPGACGEEGCTTQTFDFEQGQSNIVLDSVGWVAGIPSKILLFNRSVDNHSVSPKTQQALRDYLAANDLTDVKVRVNQYDPLGEWKRLITNDSIHMGWRYTVGALVTARYTLLPGRILGGDEYNPFTNSIHLYSDRESIALREGAHAKMVAESNYRGLWSSSMFLPGSPLWIDTPATRDVLAYSKDTGERKLEREVYLVLFPAFGSRVGESMFLFIDVGEGPVVEAGFTLVGHAVGRTMAALASDSPLEVAKSIGGIVKKKKAEPPARPVADESLQNPLPPLVALPLEFRFQPLELKYTSDNI